MADTYGRALTVNERVHAAHAIREIDDRMLGFARALDARNGMHTVTVTRFNATLESLIKRLEGLRKE